MKAKPFLIVALVFSLMQSVAGQDSSTPDSERNFLEFIPTHARIGLAWPKVTELGPRAFKLAQEVYPGSGQLIRSSASSFFNDAGIDYTDPDFSEIIDRSNPGATFGVKVDGYYHQVNVLPVGDLKKLAMMLQVDPDELNSGKILLTGRRRYVMLAGDFIYASPFQAALENSRPENSIRQFIDQDQQRSFLKSDAVLFLDYQFAVDFQNSFFELFGDAPWLSAFEDDPANELAQLISRSSRELAFGLIGIKLDGGLGLSYTSFFRDVDDSQVQRLIEAVRGGDGHSNLQHLPAGNLIAAFAATGNGEKNVTTAQAFLKTLVNYASPGEEVLSEEDKRTFYQSFSDVWRQLNGSRVALYRIQSSKPQDGQLAAVAILDVERPRALLAQFPKLAKFANESAQRNAVLQGSLPIRFSYQSAGDTIDGRQVDILSVDTERLDEEILTRTRLLLGEHAAQIKFVAVENHLLVLVGTDTQLLKQAIDNVVNRNDGLKSSAAIRNANRFIDERRKIEAHLSFPNLLDLYKFKKQLKPFQPSDELSSFAITIESKRVGVDAWLPAREIDAAVDWILMLW